MTANSLGTSSAQESLSKQPLTRGVRLSSAPAVPVVHVVKEDDIAIDNLSSEEDGTKPLWEVLASKLEHAERTLAVQHAHAVKILQQHLGSHSSAPAVSRAPTDTPGRPATAPPQEGSSHSRLQAWHQHAFADPCLPALVASGRGVPRPSSTASVITVVSPAKDGLGVFLTQPGQDEERPQLPTPRARPGAIVPKPPSDEPKLPTNLPGQLEAPFQALSRPTTATEEAGSEFEPSSAGLVKLELLPIWVKRRARHRRLPGMPRGSTREVLPAPLFEDDDEPVHTFRPKGRIRHFILHPMSFIRSFWDVASLTLVVYDIIMIPMGFFDLPDDALFLQVCEWLTRIFWTVDMGMSFLSGFVCHDGSIELRPPRIARRYMRSWFTLDIIVVGTDWFELLVQTGIGVTRLGKSSRALRIIRMVRLLRLARAGEIMHLLLERLPSDILMVFGDIIKLMIGMVGMAHLIACIWWAVGKDGAPGKNWIDSFDWANSELHARYIISMRWALTQFTGGMDEVVPVNFAEQLYAAFVFVIAFWSGTVFLSILTSHMTQLFLIGSQQTQQLSALRRYLSQHGVSRGLAMRAQRNAQHVMNAHQRTMSEQAVGLLELVSKALRIELHYEMYSPALSMHPFLHDYMQVCPHVVRKICHSSVSVSANSTGDVIFHLGEASSGMVIVKSGRLRYAGGSNKVPTFTFVEEGAYMAEAALWVHWVHRGSLTVVEDSIVFHVHAESFQAIVSQFEHTSFDPSEYADWFVTIMNASKEQLTDLPLDKAKEKALSASLHRAPTKVLSPKAEMDMSLDQQGGGEVVSATTTASESSLTFVGERMRPKPRRANGSLSSVHTIVQPEARNRARTNLSRICDGFDDEEWEADDEIGIVGRNRARRQSTEDLREEEV